MKTSKCAGTILLLFLFFIPSAFALTPVEDSAEDIYWEKPMTVHDYKKKSDLHNIAVSTMALTELEFVRLGDGILNFSLRSKKNPIARSLDSLEYAYSKLPRIEPVRRFGQLWDALQLRQISLSDARIVSSILFTDGYGGITPIMQVRVYKLVVFVEDIIYDVDGAIMFPFNWGLSALRDKPTKIKSLGYVADGVGILRWNISVALKYINKKVVRLGSDIILGIEKIHDVTIRRKRKKANVDLLIYSKMPLEVFKENQSYFTEKKKPVFVGTLPDWYDKVFHDPTLLPEDIRDQNVQIAEPEPALIQNSPQEIILATDYTSWEKTSIELKKYVITSDELRNLLQRYNPPHTPEPSPS